MRKIHEALGLLLLAACAEETAAQSHEHAAHSLGTLEFPVSCSEEARIGFTQAAALLHHMTYPQAREAFEHVAATDPHCAMAHWGIAMTLFQPLWPTRPDLQARQLGWQEVQKAKSLQPPTRREQLFVAAAEAFFLEPESTDYWLRIRRWEQSLTQAHAALPDDSEISAFYALSLLATTPSNAISRSHADKAAAILLCIYKQNPEHPGAMHYLVHANDVPGRERELLDITHKYESVAPRNPHALHMPTHIYTRLGDWDGAIRGNLQAAEAALEHPAGEHGELVWDEFPHAIEYLVYGYLQQGSDDKALAQVQRLRATAHLEPTFKAAFHLASTQARYALERRDWEAASRIVPRQPGNLQWDRFPWPEAIAQFAHGLGAVHVGHIAEAETASRRLATLEATSRSAGEDLFSRNIQLLQFELDAWLAHAKGEPGSSLQLMRQATELETSTPKHAVTPGPTLPAHELLGDLLMQQQQPAQALKAYQRSLELYPRRFNSLLGAARAARALQDEPVARSYYRELLEVAEGKTQRAALNEARLAVAKH